MTGLKPYAKTVAAVLGVIAQAISLGLLHGRALNIAQIVLALATALGVYTVPNTPTAKHIRAVRAALTENQRTGIEHPADGTLSPSIYGSPVVTMGGNYSSVAFSNLEDRVLALETKLARPRSHKAAEPVPDESSPAAVPKSAVHKPLHPPTP